MGLLFAQSKKVCVFEVLAVFTSCLFRITRPVCEMLAVFVSCLFRITRPVFVRCWLFSHVVCSG